jgi:rhodanese-related sulfurtransferase
MSVKSLCATALKTKLDQGEPLFLLDVREQNEFDYAQIADSVLIPLQDLPLRISELNPRRPTVVICHRGFRSHRAAEFLVGSGFTDVTNLEGGIEAWSLDCDSAVRRY